MAYFAASADKPEKNRRFAESLELDFPILSDPERSTARAYGVLRVGLVPSRHTFIIGQDGRILEINRKVRPGSAGEDLVAMLENLGVRRLR